jgi:hypothetical protein
MALSRIDYEKVDPIVFSILSLISNLETVISQERAPQTDETLRLITALDDYRNSLALYIEEKARRS